MTFIKNCFVVAFAAALPFLGPFFGADAARAAFPENPINLIVAYRAGGSADASARLVGDFVEKYLGQPVVVSNKSGGGGAVAANLVKKRKPDGYTVLMNASLTYTSVPFMNEKVGYKWDDFTHIATLTEPQNALVSQPSKQWKDLAGMIRYFKSQNKAIAFTAQVQLARYIADIIAIETGAKFKIVPVKGGSAAGQQLLGGHVDLVWGGGWQLKYVKTGKMQVVASLGRKRLSYAPAIPTVGEMGYKDIYIGVTFMISGPKGMPRDVLNVLNGAFNRALKEPKITDVFVKKFAFHLPIRTPDEVEAYMRDEAAKYRNFIRAAKASKQMN